MALNFFHKILFATWVLNLPFITPSASSQNQDRQEELIKIQNKIEESTETKKELISLAEAEKKQINALTQNMVKTAQHIQSQEETLSQNERGAIIIEVKQNAREASLEGRSENLLRTLAALQKLSQHPPELVLLRPDKAINTIRSASLLATTLPAIQKKAHLLRKELEELENLEFALLVKKKEISLGLNELNKKRTSLSQLITARKNARRNLLGQADDEVKIIAKLAQEAQDIKSLLTSLNIERARKDKIFKEAAERVGEPKFSSALIPKGKPISKARGHLTLPVIGEIVENFGSRSQVSNTRGIRIETRKGAQVITPFDGRVVFSGPFRTYGQLLIIDHGEGYHTLLAGMKILDGGVGQWVLEGEPIGTMDSYNMNGVSLNMTIRKPELYVELRHNGNPVNPLPWMAPRSGKAIGR